MVLVGLVLLSLALNIWQFVVAFRFPLHQRVVPQPFAPPITLLKPLKGCDSETARCLRSWLDQNYAGEVQILFGVDSCDDPACGVVLDLLAVFPRSNARLVVCKEKLGANAKVSTLIQLERLANFEILIASDADVEVPPDFLIQAVAPLRESSVGLVTCFYKMTEPSNWAMHWEAIAVNADFWSQVLQARSLGPLNFALGAVMAARRKRLAAGGGFVVLVDYLADDYRLGQLIARSGARIELCPIVVACRSAPVTFGHVWRHQLRWAQTIRACRPAAYFFSILSNLTFWGLLPMAACGVPPMHMAQKGSAAVAIAVSGQFILFSLCLFLRLSIAWFHERKLSGIDSSASWWLAPVKDLLQSVIWAVSFLVRNVTWRGQRYRVLRDGKLVRIS